MNQATQSTNSSPKKQKKFQQNNLIHSDVQRSLLESDDHVDELNEPIPKHSSWHVRSLISTFLLVGGIDISVLLNEYDVIQISTLNLVAICVLVYAIYLLMSLYKNPMLSYLSHVENAKHFQSSYNQIRSINGHFIFHAQCYHYQEHEKIRTVTDANGNKHDQTYKVKQKVVTHRATQQLNPIECVDKSGNIQQIKPGKNIIFVHNKIDHQFTDEKSKKVFEDAWEAFQAKNKKDQQQDFSQIFELPGLIVRICFYVGQRPKNYKGFFILFSIIGLIWPFEIYFESKTQRFDIKYLKVISF